jgi:hypothetical protein
VSLATTRQRRVVASDSFISRKEQQDVRGLRGTTVLHDTVTHRKPILLCIVTSQKQQGSLSTTWHCHVEASDPVVSVTEQQNVKIMKRIVSFRCLFERSQNKNSAMIQFL